MLKILEQKNNYVLCETAEWIFCFSYKKPIAAIDLKTGTTFTMELEKLNPGLMCHLDYFLHNNDVTHANTIEVDKDFFCSLV